MMLHKETRITRDESGKKLLIDRDFAAPVDAVWRAWTESPLLDQWWAPRPWKARTKTMDFREGGYWLYAMVGPDGTEQWCRADYQKVVTNEMYEGSDAFCDAEGNPSGELPSMHWLVRFTPVADHTRVHVEVSFNTEADLEAIVKMGFKEGFTAAHGNLDELLE